MSSCTCSHRSFPTTICGFFLYMHRSWPITFILPLKESRSISSKNVKTNCIWMINVHEIYYWRTLFEKFLHTVLSSALFQLEVDGLIPKYRFYQYSVCLLMFGFSVSWIDTQGLYFNKSICLRRRMHSSPMCAPLSSSSIQHLAVMAQ